MTQSNIKMNKGIFIFIIAVLTSFTMSGQNVATAEIRWNSSTWSDATSGFSFDQSTTITTSADRIVWKTAGDSVIYDMNISNVIGSWTNVTQLGSIRFQADAGEYSSILEFRKTGTRTFVRILVAKPEEPLNYEVEITGIEVL